MVELSGRSPGVSAREIDLSGPQRVTPVGVPAGVIGTAVKGPAFVPITVASIQDFIAVFGTSDGTQFGPLAAAEWLRNAQALTYCRVLGAGDGTRRTTSSPNAGSVNNAGFVVGDQLPGPDGFITSNPYANFGGPLGRLHFLGCFMSESAGSVIFSSAGIQTPGTNQAAPIIRAVIMAASGVVPMLSSSAAPSSAPSAAQVASTSGPNGAITGSVDVSNGLQNFVLLLNGHKGTDPSFPNIITASFDTTAANYFGSILNSDPLKIQNAGYVLYNRYDINSALAVVTGTGVVSASVANPATIAFLTTGSQARNVGLTTVPSYENFQDRFTTPGSPSVISQKFGGRYQDLFRVFLRSDGAGANGSYKLSIENINASIVNDKSFGSFDLVLRSIDDVDDNQVVIEQFRGLSLDPSSDQYIARRIGDYHTYYDFDKNVGFQKITVDGKYPNVSSRIRVQMDPAVDRGQIDPTALPIGFRGPFHLVTSGSDPLTDVVAGVSGSALPSYTLKCAVEPPIPYRDNLTVGVDPKRTVNPQLYWGVQFEQKISLTEPNKTKVAEPSIQAFGNYLPTFQTTWQNVSVGENHDTPDQNGTVLDSDRFNNNVFALDRVQVVTGSNGIIDATKVVSMSYVRTGLITQNDTNKTRAWDTKLDFSDVQTRNLRKFSFLIQGGFDGVNIFNNDTLQLTNAAVQQEMNDSNRGQNAGPTVSAYNVAIGIMANTSDVDVKLLAVPGIRHSIVTNTAIHACEVDRFDAMYIMDIDSRDTLNAIVTSSLQDINVSLTSTAFNARGLDTSFAAAYFPDVVMANPFNGLNAVVPPSVVTLGAFALNDAVSFPWFAPAGFTRGALQTTISPALLLSTDNLDTLQDARINPIIAQPNSGPVIWGQKTLQAVHSALDRVNVRRLLIEVRRQVRAVANTLLFEPNRESTLAKFSGLVTPLLQRIQEQQGVNRYKVLIDTTTTTQADVENNTIRGKIFIEPTRTAEFVSIDFVVANASRP